MINSRNNQTTGGSRSSLWKIIELDQEFESSGESFREGVKARKRAFQEEPGAFAGHTKKSSLNDESQTTQ